jgi:hypothetical protein
MIDKSKHAEVVAILKAERPGLTEEEYEAAAERIVEGIAVEIEKLLKSTDTALSFNIRF